MSRPGPAPRGTFLRCARDNAAANARASPPRRERAPLENREKCRGEGKRPQGPGEHPRGEGESPNGRGECPGGQRKRPSGLRERPGVCPGLLPERGALRPGRTPPTRVSSAEQGNVRSGAAAAESPGRPANPCRAGRAPRTPPAGALRTDGDTRSPQGVCGWPCSAPPRLFPPPRRLATHRDRAGRWALFHRGRGEAGRGAGAERGAGRGGRPCAEEGGGGGRRRGAALSSPLGGGGGGGGGSGLQEIQTLRQEIGILTKHSRPAAAPLRGLPPRLTLGPPGTLQGTGV
jgi:hypothetical protein